MSTHVLELFRIRTIQVYSRALDLNNVIWNVGCFSNSWNQCSVYDARPSKVWSMSQESYLCSLSILWIKLYRSLKRTYLQGLLKCLLLGFHLLKLRWKADLWRCGTWQRLNGRWLIQCNYLTECTLYWHETDWNIRVPTHLLPWRIDPQRQLTVAEQEPLK